MNYHTVAKRIQIQTDDEVVADSAERAATMIARGESDAPHTKHSLFSFFEVEVFDQSGKSCGMFEFDANLHVVKARVPVPPPIPTPPAPVPPVPIPVPPAPAPIPASVLPIAVKELKGELPK